MCGGSGEEEGLLSLVFLRPCVRWTLADGVADGTVVVRAGGDGGSDGAGTFFRLRVCVG